MRSATKFNLGIHMSKPYLHVMRVRIQKRVFEALQTAATEEIDRRGEHVTVSDIVRAACHDWLVKHQALRALENLPHDLWRREEEEAVYIITAPML